MGVNNSTTRALFDEQDGKCFYCDVEMLWTPVKDGVFKREYFALQATFDHVKLKSEGGSNAKENGVCACWKCNTMRSNLPQDVFIKHFDFLTEQWELGNRTPRIMNYTGELVCISKPKFKRLIKNHKKRQRNIEMICFLIAHTATQIGETVEDFFHSSVYNNSYTLKADFGDITAFTRKL